MSSVRRFFLRLFRFLRPLQAERELGREIDFHLALLQEEFERCGLTAEEARVAAKRAFGGPPSPRSGFGEVSPEPAQNNSRASADVEQAKERQRDARSFVWLEDARRDLRFAFRMVARGPIFSVFAVASLALGIGGTTGIFSLFDAIVLKQLPVPEPEQLFVASFGRPGGNFNYSLPYPHFEQIRQRNTTLDGIFAFYPFGRVTVTVSGDAEMAAGTYVTGDYYSTLHLTPALGRLIGPADDNPGQTVAVLNHAYWLRRFGGRPDIVGTIVHLNQIPFTIAGVEPVGFFGTEVGRPYDLAIPMRTSELLTEGKPLWNEAFATWIYMMGRLKPGVTLATAEQELKGIFAQVSLDAARTSTEMRLARENQLRLEPGARGSDSDLRQGYERWLRLVLMMLGAVLLLASLNIATLLLSRSEARQREIATRLALGASRSRIIRQFLTESLLLAACAGVLGVLLAGLGSRMLLGIATPAAERLPLEATTDWRVITFACALSVSTCLLFGLVPAIRATSARRLVTSRQIGGGRSRHRLDSSLVAAQIALSLVLLVAAGLFLRTLENLRSQNPGYNRQNVLMFSVDARLAGKTGEDVPRIYQRILDELRTVPAAQAVTLSAVRPVSDNYYFISSFTRVGGRTLSDEQRVRTAYNNVAPGYFATLGIPLVAGRDFDDRDSRGAPKVAIVSETMARHFAGDPIGQTLGSPPRGEWQIVGIVRNVRYARVKDAPRDVVYFPIFQSEPKDIGYSPTYELRYVGAPSDVIASARQVVSRIDSGLTMFRVKTLERQTEESFVRERLLALLSTYLGCFAGLLACVGLYGLISYGVARRTPEMALRIALGARPGSVQWLVVREGGMTALAGVSIGLAAAHAIARLVQTQLYGVEPTDPGAIVGATALLVVVALAAAYVPARRASGIDPISALRQE